MAKLQISPIRDKAAFLNIVKSYNIQIMSTDIIDDLIHDSFEVFVDESEFQQLKDIFGDNDKFNIEFHKGSSDANIKKAIKEEINILLKKLGN